MIHNNTTTVNLKERNILLLKTDYCENKYLLWDVPYYRRFVTNIFHFQNVRSYYMYYYFFFFCCTRLPISSVRWSGSAKPVFLLSFDDFRRRQTRLSYFQINRIDSRCHSDRRCPQSDDARVISGVHLFHTYTRTYKTGETDDIRTRTRIIESDLARVLWEKNKNK